MSKYDFNLDIYDDNTLNWIAKTISQGSRVLEFGAANGRLTKYLKEYKNCQVDIVEIDENAGSDAEKHAKRFLIGEEKGDIEKYYWIDWGKVYDYIVFADVLEHLINPDEVLKRCKAVLKDEGEILVSIPNIAHNSIIIDLFRNKFTYTPIGLLDNTHLRFFTRDSFIAMANSAGWAVTGECSKNIRVGETEINNSYEDVPKEIFKELINRENCNVYQYFFVLASKERYLMGQVSRKVFFERSAYYYTEVYFDNHGKFDWQKSVIHYIFPQDKMVSLTLDVLENSTQAHIKLINSNCIINNLEINADLADGSRKILNYMHNGVLFKEKLFFAQQTPVVIVQMDSQYKKINLNLTFERYDFEDSIITDLLKELIFAEKKLDEISAGYEAMIAQKDREFLESCEKYEKMILRKDKEFLESCQKYESVIEEKNELIRIEAKKKGLFK